MRHTKLFTVLLIIIGSFLFTDCVTSKRSSSCLYPKSKGYKYTPRLQGGRTWNYKKYMGPKRKVK
jgi:hypothetical protein